MESSSEYLTDIIHQKPRKYNEREFASEFKINRTVQEPAYLDIGESIAYRIPQTYEKLAATLKLPTTSEIRVDEFYLKGTLDLGSLAAMMAADKKVGQRSRAGIGESKPQYESLQARLKSQAANNSIPKFSLKVKDIPLDASSIPEGAAGAIRRSIMSEGGVLQVYYVKVLEKGDTYEIIERSLPKKQRL